MADRRAAPVPPSRASLSRVEPASSPCKLRRDGPVHHLRRSRRQRQVDPPASAAAAWFAARGLPHLVTHEPGGTPLAHAMREVFLDPRWGAMDGTVELLLVFASRRQHLIEKIEPALAAGTHVLCDRFTDSTRAYQGVGPRRAPPRSSSVDGGRDRRPACRTSRCSSTSRRSDARERGASPCRRSAARSTGSTSSPSPSTSGCARASSRSPRAEPERFRIVDSSGDLATTTRSSTAVLAEASGDWRRELEVAARAARRPQLEPGARRAASTRRSSCTVADGARRAGGGAPRPRRCSASGCRERVRAAAAGTAGGSSVPRGAASEERFHPDFAWLERDLKTSTSVEATRELLRAAQLSPFEARGQVFVIADAASLSGEAADALLKAIEEPGLTAPRHFLLLAPSRLDLPPTLRSRSLSVFLGAGERPDRSAGRRCGGAVARSAPQRGGAVAARPRPLRARGRGGARRGRRMLRRSAGVVALDVRGERGARSGACRPRRMAATSSMARAGVASWRSPRRCSRPRRCACAGSRANGSSKDWSTSTSPA